MFQNEWTPFLKEEFQKPYFQQLSAFLRQQYATTKVYPPRLQVFSAFEFTNYSDVKVVILGQDPYHQPNQAHGMCFSVRKGVKVPPSLVNIYKELHDDLGCTIPHHEFQGMHYQRHASNHVCSVFHSPTNVPYWGHHPKHH